MPKYTPAQAERIIKKRNSNLKAKIGKQLKCPMCPNRFIKIRQDHMFCHCRCGISFHSAKFTGFEPDSPAKRLENRFDVIKLIAANVKKNSWVKVGEKFPCPVCSKRTLKDVTKRIYCSINCSSLFHQKKRVLGVLNDAKYKPSILRRDSRVSELKAMIKIWEINKLKIVGRCVCPWCKKIFKKVDSRAVFDSQECGAKYHGLYKQYHHYL